MSNKRDSDQVELECQFILRLPPEPAKALREMLKSGSSSLKDRLSIKLENDVRYGEVRVDHWLLHAKVVDLPTIVESLKTIDNKSFYKTADLCQMMICKEEDDQTTDEESPTKHKKKDPNKVEKKFLWPHGITPPLKNVRKRRFRKTLKKKYVEAPEVEKEVKRLLRGDMDAVSVKWEVITEEDDKKITIKEEPLEQDELELLDASANNTQNTVAERDIFGEAVSDSDEEESHLNLVDIEENSRLSPDDSRISDSMSLQMSEERGDERLVTHFSGNMFQVKAEPEDLREFPSHHQKEVISSHGMSSGLPQGALLNDFEGLESRLEEVRCQLTELKARRAQQEMEVANIENIALKQRFQEILDQLLQEQLDKEQEFQELSELLQM